MNEIVTLLFVMGAGLIIGVGYFGSLWWTIRRGLTSKHPAVFFISSLIIRISLALAGFYYIADGHLKSFLICLLGFIIGRFIIVRLIELPARTSSVEDTHYASKS